MLDLTLVPNNACFRGHDGIIHDRLHTAQSRKQRAEGLMMKASASAVVRREAVKKVISPIKASRDGNGLALKVSQRCTFIFN